MSPIVAYYRVSDQKQGRSGLGLEAQKKAIASFATAEGFTVVAEFTEIETGKGADALDRRPQLQGGSEGCQEGQGFGCCGQARPAEPRRCVYLRADVAEGSVHRRFAGAGCPVFHAAHLRGSGGRRAPHDLLYVPGKRCRPPRREASSSVDRRSPTPTATLQRLGTRSWEPTLRELSGLSSRAAAAEIERRGLGKISYITVVRARARLGLAV